MRIILLAAVAASVAVVAQEQKVERDVVIRRAGPEGAGWAGTMAAPAFHVAFDNATPVKGAPYAAEAVTERVQVLADGNRIVEKNTSKQYRDSEGRTRMENAMGPMMAFVPAGGKMTLVFIDDPVGGVHYTLRPDEKTAEKMQMPKMVPSPEGATTQTVTFQKEVGQGDRMFVAGTATAGVPAAGAGPAVMVYSRRSMDANAPQSALTKQALGKRNIEGVEAEGSKITETIPAGAMGNEKPIETVTEVWFSSELKMDVLRRTTDPRFGETSYKLTSIIRGEQPRNLFEPPADYKVTESQMMQKIRAERLDRLEKKQ